MYTYVYVLIYIYIHIYILLLLFVVAAVASLVVKARSRLIKMKREGKSHEDHHEQFIGEGRVEDPEKVRVDPVKVNTPYEIALQYKTPFCDERVPLI